jgi:hypothetical protein
MWARTWPTPATGWRVLCGILGKPLLLAEHDPCLLFTKEGYEAAVAAFPDSKRVSCREKLTVSPAFARALREFCVEVVS